MAGNQAAARPTSGPASRHGREESEADGEAVEDAAPRSLVARLKALGRLRLALLASPILLMLLGAGAALSGALDPLLIQLGLLSPATAGSYTGPPVFVELPDLLVNLSTGSEIHMLKASISLELAGPNDKAIVHALMPRIQDTLQTRLRSLTAEDLKGTAQAYRLRAELRQRLDLALGPGHVREVLFRDLIVR